MKYSVKFNGVELNDYLYVTEGFTPYLGAAWSPSSQSYNGHVNGEEFLYQKHGAKTISMPFCIQDNIGTKFDELQKILNVSEPKQLTFESQPDRYYLAIPTGELNFDQVYNMGTGTIEWYVPDGLAHSTVLKEFTASENSDGILEATIVNNGTVEVPISYEITHSADNGYIGIVSENGAMQYGSVEEADGETYKQTERLSTINNFISAADDHGTCYLQTDADTSGTLTTKSVIGSTWLGLGNAGNGVHWNGGMRTITIPADSEGVYGSENFQIGMHRWFQKDHYKEIGLQIINVMGDTHTQIVGIKVYSTVETYENSVAEFWANGRMYARKIFRAGQQIWSPGMKSNMWNPYRYDVGTDLIRKEGQKITFYYDARQFSYNIPELQNVEATRIQLGFFRATTRPIITANYYKTVDFNKLNVEKWKDNPNRYSSGDVIKIDGDSRKFYVNGIVSQGDETKGTKYFNAPIGESTVQILRSSWAKAPAAKVYIREAYL